jgi:hypothetical protein
MAETSFNTIPPSASIPSAEVNRVGLGHGVAAANAVADDRAYHGPLNIPVPEHLQPAPAVEQPPPSPPLTELELRQRLVEAIAAYRLADQAEKAAEAVAQRAAAHVAACQQEAASFHGLDAEIDRATVEALRSSEFRPRPDLPPALRERITARERAQLDLASAERVAAMVADEFATAREAARQAEAKMRRAVSAVIGCARQVVRAELAAIERRAAAAEQILARADTGHPWSEVVERLLADPLSAALDVEVPLEPLAEPPPPLFVVPRDEILDMATGEKMTMAQFMAREREARLHELSATPLVLREQAAAARGAAA